MGLGFVVSILGINRFRAPDRLDIDRYTSGISDNQVGLTETYWPIFGAAGGIGAFMGFVWLFTLGLQGIQFMKISIHLLTTYLAVISVLCFWIKQLFWGITFSVGATLQFLYVLSVIDRIPFTMLVLQKAIEIVWNLPQVIRVSFGFMVVMLCWMVIWTFGAAGVVASSMGDSGRWWFLVVFSVSLFWTGAVLSNMVHVVVSGIVFLVLNHDARQASTIPQIPTLNSLKHAVTTSFGSICYGSLFTASIRTLRWEIRAVRSKIGNNECLLCLVDFLFHIVETLVRFFNKYAYVQIAVNGTSFNHSARDAWELLQSTGVEALVAYDCSGSVLLMAIIIGGLITGTSVGVYTWFRWRDRLMMVATTSMLMGMVLVSLALVIVESAVTSIYICFAEDPLMIQRWDAEFYDQMSEVFHQRLQYRSARRGFTIKLNQSN